ncbi:hypothetical protein GSI_12215 [Ganoderma sinense ZZ0214-1]|uniref:BTB domain-containing protein n=1 Tax=Ganoderma sinense ZZ0214-1 TaxID=1077348 RepID=A0A2G8RY97_9APHY|nr:hypothetical protein GSI_12215 [Ganoderma sinense ZZ0214-1]
MSQDLRPPKRRRDGDEGSEASQDPLDGLKRSEEFWIPDGNIVLIAGKTAFRVYRGLLTLQSTVFSDLFASSSPRAEESHDGCPVILLTDSAQDLTHLLRVLLPSSRTFYHRGKDDPDVSFHEVSAVIRLTHKYHIEGLLRQALSSLQEIFTTSFKIWEDDSRRHPISIEHDSAYIAVVGLARLTDTPSLLPLALYKCCSLRGAIVDGWEREDGTVEYLPPEDLKRCINARDSFAKEAFSLVSAIFDPAPSKRCKTFSTCKRVLRKVFREILDHKEVAEPGVLNPWNVFIRDCASLEDEDRCCSLCEGKLLERDTRERERIWNRLPEIFDIEVPNWNQDPDTKDDGDGHDDANSNDAGN